MRTCIICLLLIFASPCLCIAQPPLKVGVIAGFTGDWAAYGKSYQVGLSIADENAPKKGLLRFYYEDDQFTPRISLSAMRKLVSEDSVDILVVGDTPTAIALAENTAAKNIPMVAWASEDPAFVNKKNIFLTWPALHTEVDLVTAEVQRLNISHIALWAGPHNHAVSFIDSLQQSIPDRVAVKEDFSEDLTDYRASLLQLKAKGITNLGLCLNSGQNAVAIRQANEIKLELSYFGCNFLNNVDDISALKKAGASAWIFDTDVSESFRHDYLDKTKTLQFVNSAAVLYDTGLVLQKIAALRSQGSGLIASFNQLGTINGANGEFSLKHDNGQQYFDFKLVRKNL